MTKEQNIGLASMRVACARSRFDVLVSPAAQYAVLLCPDDASRPLRQERGARQPDGATDARLPPARIAR